MYFSTNGCTTNRLSGGLPTWVTKIPEMPILWSKSMLAALRWWINMIVVKTCSSRKIIPTLIYHVHIWAAFYEIRVQGKVIKCLFLKWLNCLCTHQASVKHSTQGPLHPHTMIRVAVRHPLWITFFWIIKCTCASSCIVCIQMTHTMIAPLCVTVLNIIILPKDILYSSY